MDFKFNINDILKNKITKIKRDMLPDEFSGDSRSAWQCASRISDIIDCMGIASAKAQGLQKAITSGDRLRSFDHTVYLLSNPEGNNGNGSVVGLLKIGRKKLFVFDISGHHHEMEPLCVLDFYVHESMQRVGCGKLLYEHMLKEEQIKPESLAIDRPSEKFLAFLYKHYNLSNIIPQANNYVIFDGFFNSHSGTSSVDGRKNSARSTVSHRAPWHNSSGSFDCVNQSPAQYYAFRRPTSSVGKLLQQVTPEYHQSNRRTSAGHSFGCGMSPFKEKSNQPAYEVTIREEPKAGKSVNAPGQMQSAPVKHDLKFHHTPLWVSPVYH